MEPLFSSPQHMSWFILSMVILAVTLAIWKIAKRSYFIGPVGFHATAVVQAAIVVSIIGNGPVYSVHCIWFNALMAAVYLLLWRYVRHRQKT